RLERYAEAGAPASRFAFIIGEDVGLQRGELPFAHLVADRLDAVETFDRRLVPGGMIDAPGCAVRPVDPNAISDLAAEQLVAGHTKQFSFGIEQGILDPA